MTGRTWRLLLDDMPPVFLEAPVGEDAGPFMAAVAQCICVRAFGGAVSRGVIADKHRSIPRPVGASGGDTGRAVAVCAVDHRDGLQRGEQTGHIRVFPPGLDRVEAGVAV